MYSVISKENTFGCNLLLIQEIITEASCLVVFVQSTAFRCYPSTYTCTQSSYFCTSNTDKFILNREGGFICHWYLQRCRHHYIGKLPKIRYMLWSKIFMYMHYLAQLPWCICLYPICCLEDRFSKNLFTNMIRQEAKGPDLGNFIIVYWRPFLMSLTKILQFTAEIFQQIKFIILSASSIFIF